MKGNRERMGEKRRGKGIIAWMLSFVMVLSLVMVPAGKVEAAEDLTLTVSSTPEKVDQDGHVEVEISAPSGYATIQALKDAGYTKLQVSYNITSYTQSDSGTAGMQPYYAYGDKWTYYTGGVWKNFSDGATGTITLDFSSSTTGTSDELKRFGLQFCNVTGDIAYSITSAKLVGGSSSGEAGNESNDWGTTRDYSTNVTAVIENQEEPTTDWSGFNITLNNNTNSTICDWIIVLELPSGAGAGFQCWNSVYIADGDTIYLYPKNDGTNAVVSSNVLTAYVPGFGVGGKKIYADEITVKTVYYNIGTSSQYDYSSGSSNDNSGSGGGSTGEIFDGSNIGTIDTSLDYNFAKLLQYSLYFYDANMCGDQVSETSLYSKDLYNGWRGDCHVNDKFTYNGKTYSAVGGFHDAGDHVKFGLPMSQAMTALGMGYYEFGDAFDELGQKNHLKTITDYYCTYVKSCTVLNEAGTQAEAFCYQVGHGDKDHASWVAPEVEDESATERTYTLVATSSNPATDIVSGTAAALTLNYLNFGNKEDLKYAKALFSFAKSISASNRSEADYQGGFYHSGWGGWQDEYCLAAALLYMATNDSSYATEYTSNDANNGNIEKPYGWENAYQAAVFYAPDSSGNKASHTQTIQNWFNTKANESSSSYYCGDSWGSARVNCNVQFMMMVSDKHAGTNTYGSWCRYQMSQILGNNSLGKNLVCGYNTNSPTKPHHRAASGYSGWNDFNSNATQKYTLYGALCGGPTSTDFSTYVDKVNDAVANEVALDYNACFVGSAAALYLLYKDCEDAGFTNQSIHPDFYGGSNFISAGGTIDVVTSINLDDDALVLEKGETTTLTATVETSDGSTPEISWSSSDEDVATVDSTGKVTAVAGGTAIITAKAGSKKATCEVTVTSAVEGVSLDQTTLTLEKEGTATLVPTITPADATNKKITWFSDNKKVATVDEAGKVIALAGGTAIITATTEDGAKTATCTVTVINPVKSISLNKTSTTIHKGDTETLTVTVNPTDADAHNIQFSSDDESVATVDTTTGEITAVSVGTATITATVTQENGTKKFTEACKVEVVVPLTGIAIDKTSLELTTNGDNTTDVLTVSPKPTDAVLGTVTWSSSDETVATVSGTGASATVTAKKSGTATITATVKGENDTYTVTSDVTVTTLFESVSFDKMLIELEQGEATTLVCSITPADVAIEKIEWVKEDTGEHEIIAMTGGDEIIDGKASVSIEALIKGRTWITAIITPKQGEGDSVACEVNVVGKKVTGVELQDKNAAEISELSMTIGDEEQLTAIVTPEDADNKTVTWTSDNVDVVTVDKTGTITAVGIGDAVVTAQAGNVKATCSVKVSKKVQVTPTVHAYTVNKRTSSGFEVSADVSWPETGSTKMLEYSIDGGQTWSSTGVFSGLKAFTKYTVCTRAAGNAEYEASKIATETKEIYTLAQDPYTIDVSIFADENAEKYVETFYAEDGTQTIAYDAKTKTLTLLDTDTTYTITGEKTDLVITAPNDGDVNIVLQNAIIKRLDVTKQNTSSDATVDIEIKGTVQVDEIVSNSNNYVTISGTGTLNASNITVVGELKINGSTVNVDASSNNEDAIVVGKVVIRDSTINVIGGNGIVAETDVVINGAEMTITGGAGCAGIVAGENITIENTELTVNVGEGSQQSAIVADSIVVSSDSKISSDSALDKLYSSTPKDENGKEIAIFTVLLYKEDGTTQMLKASFYSGSRFTLPDLTKQAGCILSWKEKSTGKLYEPKTVVTVQNDLTFVISIEKIKVTKITLDSTLETITVGDGVALAETVEPSNAYDDSVTWTSSNPDVATVDKDGNVTGVAAGVTVIIATANDGSGKSASCTVTVVEAEPEVVAVEKIKITGATQKVAPGKKLKLKATVYPENATNQTIKWKVNNKKYASVNSKGVVTTKKAGKGKKVTVTAYSAEDNSIKATYKISIMKNAVKKIKLSAKTTAIKKGKSVKIKVTFAPTQGISKELIWTSSNKKIATVDSKGKVTGRKKGTVKITAKAKDGSGKKATIQIRIK